MHLKSGDQLAAFEIVEPIGAGGMGEVFKARDTKLGREVAIKVLPEAFAENKERLARFEREARLLASLNHPNIATLFELQESGGVHFLVMELVSGETLADRIKRGPIPVDEALTLFKQIAEALEAAHDKGVIHRDLKPANIKVTPEGKTKVLDFGLAKAMEPEVPVEDSSQSPTLTKGTALGAIMGTAAYMSPEQARGKTVDKRTDIWAYGCCLYETLTGRKACEGETVTDTLAAVVNKEPAWEALPRTTPWKTREILQRCLRKDERTRLRDIGDARIELEENSTAPPQVETASSKYPNRWSLAVLVLGAILAGVGILNMMRSAPVPQPHSRFAINLPDDAPVNIRGFPSVALSPDGTKLVYVVQRTGFSQLYCRDVEAFEAEVIPGTENGIYPFFSPDGEWIGYYNVYSGQLEKVWIHGGAPVGICETDFGDSAASWGQDGTIVFGQVSNGSLYRVSAAGGSPQILTSPDREKGVKIHRFPQILPDGESVLFMIGTSTISSYDDATIAVVSLRTGGQQVLLEGGSNPRYLPTGHIVFSRTGSLMAVPFDIEKLEVRGEPVEVLEGIASQAGTGAALFSISRGGELAYVPSSRDATFVRLVLVDKTGEIQPISLELAPYTGVRVSPDGMWLALMMAGANNQIWLYELKRGTLMRLTSAWDNLMPRWTPDGSRVAFMSNRHRVREIFWKPVDGSGPEERIQSGEHRKGPASWSPDGKMLAYWEVHPTTGRDIWFLSMDGERRAQPFLVTEFNEIGSEFSPDGRWLAYCSDETGSFEVYVRPVSGTGRRVQISTGGGDQPGWSRDGREIFYRQDRKMMAVAVEAGEELVAGKPKELFEIERDVPWPYRSYGITPDGRFVMMEPLHESTSKKIHVVLNWFDELKSLVPTN